MSQRIRTWSTASLIALFAVNIFAQESMVLSSATELEIHSYEKALLTVRQIILIGQEKYKSHGKIIINENALRTLKSVKGEIRDVNGNRLKKLRKRDVREIEYSPGYVLYSGDRYTVINLSSPELPYILEYEYTIELHSLFEWTNWYPQSDIPVMSASYRIHAPAHIQYSFYTIGDTPEPKVLSRETIQWTCTNLPPRYDEYRTPPEEKNQYGLLFAPKKFVLFGTKGAFDSWKSFGQWADKLYREQMILDSSAASDLAVSVNDNVYTRIQTIYEYIQQNTRYVAVELGLHGWIPHPAQTICDNRYGDCKDLAILFISLLKKYDIEAYPAIIRTADAGVVPPDFPATLFNHVIACIPLTDDTLWVDCTSKNSTVRDLPWWDEGVYCLVLARDNTALIRTPLSQSINNQHVFTAKATLLPSGSVEMRGKITVTGNEEQQLRGSLLPLTAEKRRKKILKWLSDFTPAFNLDSLHVSNLTKPGESIIISFRGKAARHANTTSKRMFLNPNFYRRVHFKSEPPEKRKTSVFYAYPRRMVQKITYSFPETYRLEASHDSVNLKQDFSTFRSNYVTKGNTITYTREHDIHTRRISLDSYPDYYRFMQKIESADDNVIVLISN